MNIQNLIDDLPHCAINWDSPRLGSDDDGLPVRAWGEQREHGVMICISAEEGDGIADYYRDMYIEPRLEAWAEKHGAYFEWDSPGRIDCFINNKAA